MRMRPFATSLATSLARLGRIVRVAVRHGLGLALEGPRERWPWLARRFPGERLSRPERLRVAFEELGGTFVKFGQMLAMQPDILPIAYCNALLKLLDRMPAFPYAEAERILVEELGSKPEEIFDSFARTPIATASVGQVYAATLEGRKVAVKVRRPRVHLEFNADIRLMAGALRLIRWLHLGSCYWLIDPVSEFIAWSREELDYRYEARYAVELARQAVDNPAQHVPRVYTEYTTARTLVAEFLTGTTLLAYLRAIEEGDDVLVRRLRARGFDRLRFAGNIVSNFVGDAFRHGIYHADLHPANLIIRDGDQVGYIDFGITGQMSRYSRRHLLEMTLALSRGDLETIKTEYLKVTVHDSTSDIAGFRAGIDRLATAWYVDVGGERRLAAKITRIFSEMLALSRQTHVMPERDIVKYIRSTIAIDGLLARFAPSFDIGEHLEESCSRILAWEARRGLLAPGHALAWGGAGGRLLADGPRRLVHALERFAERETAAPHGGPGRESERDAEPVRGRALQLAAAVLGAAILVTITPAAASLGLNLWTAELAFAGTAALALAATLRRLTSRG